MTAHEHLLWVADELDRIRPAPSGTYELVVSDNRIVVRQYNRNQKPKRLLVRLDSTAVNTGLHGAKWDRLLLRIRHFIDEGILS